VTTRASHPGPIRNRHTDVRHTGVEHPEVPRRTEAGVSEVPAVLPAVPWPEIGRAASARPEELALKGPPLYLKERS
jgi:hypothetical protein